MIMSSKIVPGCFCNTNITSLVAGYIREVNAYIFSSCTYVFSECLCGFLWYHQTCLHVWSVECLHILMHVVLIVATYRHNCCMSLQNIHIQVWFLLHSNNMLILVVCLVVLLVTPICAGKDSTAYTLYVYLYRSFVWEMPKQLTFYLKVDTPKFNNLCNTNWNAT